MKTAQRRRQSSRKPWLPQCAAALALCLSLGANGQAAYTFNIRGDQQLSQALIQFSHQSGLAIVFPDQLARDIRIAGPVFGEMTTDTALQELLANTELDYRLIDERIIAVYDARCELTDSCPISP